MQDLYHQQCNACCKPSAPPIWLLYRASQHPCKLHPGAENTVVVIGGVPNINVIATIKSHILGISNPTCSYPIKLHVVLGSLF